MILTKFDASKNLLPPAKVSPAPYEHLVVQVHLTETSLVSFPCWTKLVSLCKRKKAIHALPVNKLCH